MSVMIRGMKMPKTCLECPLQFGGWCYAAPPEIDERVAETVDKAEEQKKPNWCQLVELPDTHGGLIDVSALVNIKFTDTNHDYRLGWNDAIESIIENSKVIIEEEGTE